eukprot:3465410-Amphidinium_carterae.1
MACAEAGEWRRATHMLMSLSSMRHTLDSICYNAGKHTCCAAQTSLLCCSNALELQASQPARSEVLGCRRPPVELQLVSNKSASLVFAGCGAL